MIPTTDERLRKWMVQLASQKFKKAHRSFHNVKDWKKRQSEMKKFMNSLIGPFPQKTSLKPKITGKLIRERYTIENILFESRPQFFVTGNLYLPVQQKKPAPAILFSCGHFEGGKTYSSYQRFCLELVLAGYVVFIYDPIGQGERRQYWNGKRGWSAAGGCIYEHCIDGWQGLLSGFHLTNFMVWDAIRSIDFLYSRPEVDANRIGAVGHSGGGTITTYLSIVEERVQVAAPICYITSLFELLTKGEVSDAEQVLIGAISKGIDHGDLCAAIAPKPLFIGAATSDFFPITGTRRAYQKARLAYNLLGHPERITLAEISGPHGFDQKMRNKVQRWLNKWLQPEIGQAISSEVPYLSLEGELLSVGQISSIQNAKTVFDITSKKAKKLVKKLQQKRKRIIKPDLEKDIRKVLHIPTSPTNYVKVESLGISKQYNLNREDLHWCPESALVLTATILKGSAQDNFLPTIYIDGVGRESALTKGSRTWSLASSGHLVLIPELIGMGKTKPPSVHWEARLPFGKLFLGAEAEVAIFELLIGQTLLGVRVQELIILIDYLLARNDVKKEEGVEIVTKGDAGLIALFAAVLDNRIHKVTYEKNLVSYAKLATSVLPLHPLSIYIPDVLNYFDLHEETLAKRTKITPE